jgi:hypothetical protein
MFARGHEAYIIAVTPAQKVIQNCEITHFRRHKQRLSCLTVSVVDRSKIKHITATD